MDDKIIEVQVYWFPLDLRRSGVLLGLRQHIRTMFIFQNMLETIPRWTKN
jgi:hypothetical protein